MYVDLKGTLVDRLRNYLISKRIASEFRRKLIYKDSVIQNRVHYSEIALISLIKR